MLYPLIGARLHGWLDDLVALTYLFGILLLHLGDGARAFLALMGFTQFVAFGFSDYRPLEAG